ncbi:hypothetical protein PanWU01x14_053180 [Parasponia andersonii]|uniref:Uncharacterized protein n=1 Tax=Parasponia andersonii TaxID=3476 RepID=A0A2P5DLF8_PARAD|nr:hypothetical protein PanWU01x14_053180 [Parasponia andersonii]
MFIPLIMEDKVGIFFHAVPFSLIYGYHVAWIETFTENKVFYLIFFHKKNLNLFHFLLFSLFCDSTFFSISISFSLLYPFPSLFGVSKVTQKIFYGEKKNILVPIWLKCLYTREFRGFTSKSIGVFLFHFLLHPNFS